MITYIIDCQPTVLRLRVLLLLSLSFICILIAIKKNRVGHIFLLKVSNAILSECLLKMEENKTTPSEVKEEKNNVEMNNKDGKAGQDGKEATEEQTPPTKEMKAVVLTCFGGLKAVKIQNKPEPTLGEGEVLIRVKAWYVSCSRHFSLPVLLILCCLFIYV